MVDSAVQEHGDSGDQVMNPSFRIVLAGVMLGSLAGGRAGTDSDGAGRHRARVDQAGQHDRRQVSAALPQAGRSQRATTGGAWRRRARRRHDGGTGAAVRGGPESRPETEQRRDDRRGERLVRHARCRQSRQADAPGILVAIRRAGGGAECGSWSGCPGGTRNAANGRCAGRRARGRRWWAGRRPRRCRSDPLHGRRHQQGWRADPRRIQGYPRTMVRRMGHRRRPVP